MKLNSKTVQKVDDAMEHEKFEANINPTPNGFENFYDSLADTGRQLVMTFLLNYRWRWGFNSF